MEKLRDTTKTELIRWSGDTWGQDLADNEYIIGECTYESSVYPVIKTFRKQNYDKEIAEDNFRNYVNAQAFLRYMQKHKYMSEGIYPEDWDGVSEGEQIRIIFNVDEISEEQGRAILDFIETVLDTPHACVDDKYAHELIISAIVSFVAKSSLIKEMGIDHPYEPKNYKIIKRMARDIYKNDDMLLFGLQAEMSDDKLLYYINKYFSEEV